MIFHFLGELSRVPFLHEKRTINKGILQPRHNDYTPADATCDHYFLYTHETQNYYKMDFVSLYLYNILLVKKVLIAIASIYK
jgi:hypothetical protein